MPLGAIIGGIGSAIIGGISSSSAAGAQADASAAAVAEQRRQFDLTRQDQMPWMQAGQKAIGYLGQAVMPGGALWGNFSDLGDNWTRDPGYQFRLEQGQKALGNRQAATGSYLSGGALKDLNDYTQGSASQEYNNAYNRFQNDRQTRYNMLAGVSGAGQNTAQTLGAIGQNSANNIGQALMYGGNARASGYMGIGNAINQGIGGMFDIYNMNKKG